MVHLQCGREYGFFDPFGGRCARIDGFTLCKMEKESIFESRWRCLCWPLAIGWPDEISEPQSSGNEFEHRENLCEELLLLHEPLVDHWFGSIGWSVKSGVILWDGEHPPLPIWVGGGQNVINLLQTRYFLTTFSSRVINYSTAVWVDMGGALVCPTL